MAFDIENDLKKLAEDVPTPRPSLPQEIYSSYVSNAERIHNRTIFFKRLSISVSVFAVFVLVSIFGFNKLSNGKMGVGRDAAPERPQISQSNNPSSNEFNIDRPNVYQDSIITVDLYSSYEVNPSICYIVAHITIKLDGVDTIKISANKKIEDYQIITEKNTSPEPLFSQNTNSISVDNLGGEEIIIDVCFYPSVDNTYNTNLKIFLNNVETSVKLN